MSNKKKASLNLLSSIVGQAMAIVIGLVIPRLFIVGYGSAINGLISSVNQLLIYLGLFEAGVGTVTLQALYRPVADNDKESINSILAATNTYYKKTGTYYLFGLIILSFVFPIFTGGEIDFISTAIIVFSSGIGNVVNFYYQGKYKILLQAEGKSYVVTNITSIITVLNGVSKIILLSLKVNVVVVIVIAALINLLQFFYVFFYIKKSYAWINLRATPHVQAIEQKNYVLIHQIAGLIFQNTDILIITVFCGLREASVYSVYKLVITHIEGIVNILPNSVSFALGQAYHTDIEGFKNKIDAFEVIYVALVSSVLSVTLYLFVPFVELYTKGASDIQYVDYILAIMFVVISLMTAMRWCMLNTINYAGHFKETTNRTVIETVINLVTSIVGVYMYGIYGVLFGTIAALIYRNNDIIIYSNCKLLNRSPIKTFSIHGVNVVILIVLQFIYPVLFGSIDNFFIFIIYGLILTVITLIVFACINLAIYKDIQIMAKELLNKFLKKE